jgi:hypothetical protein
MQPNFSDDGTGLVVANFSEIQWFGNWLLDESSATAYLRQDYVNILSYLSENLVQGINDKLKDIGGSEEKIRSTLSELKSARILLERGFDVELISDNDPRFTSPPDIIAVRESDVILVEVKRIESDSVHEILDQVMQPLLEKRNYILTIDLGSDFLAETSFYGNSSDDRKIKEALYKTYATNLSQFIESLDDHEFPKKFTLDDGSNISLKFADQKRGIYPETRGFWRIVPIQKYKIKIEQKLRGNKNNPHSKRESWEGEFLKHPFLIFIDLEDATECNCAVFPALYGSTTYLMEEIDINSYNLRHPYPKIIINALQGSKRELLHKLGFDCSQRKRIRELGCFMNDQSIRKNTTGVVTIMLKDKLECYPNPFCQDQICLDNLNEYLDIPLPSQIQS